MRQIKSIHKSQKVQMGNVILDQPLPVGDLESIDPFLLIHHWDDTLPGHQKPNEAGVGPHPHRGFSPVSIIYKGAIRHRDSFGNDSVVRAGGTQWMLSGRGITHSERPPADLAEEGGPLELIQFWVNLPAKHKMMTPEYIPLQAEDTPVFEDGGVKASIISGIFKGVKGGIKTVHDVGVIALEFSKGSFIDFEVANDENCLLYQLDGAVSVQGRDISYARTIYEFGHEGSPSFKIEADDDSRLLLLHGKPIREKVAQYGPFVMNDQTQIMQALRDAQMGKMGVLIEE